MLRERFLFRKMKAKPLIVDGVEPTVVELQMLQLLCNSLKMIRLK